MQSFKLSTKFLTIAEIEFALNNQAKLDLDESLISKIKACRNYLDLKIQDNATSIYGINTGFGALCNVKIAQGELSKLQHNLVRSHACGMGDEIAKDIVKLMLLLKIRSLAYGHSGVKLETVKRLINFYNHDVFPVIYSLGSLGASGDLAPLAHLALPLIGEGKVRLASGELLDSQEMNKKFDWSPLVLSEKEGLALLNGTQFMAAFGVYCIQKTQKLFDWSMLISALSCDAFDCKSEPFHPLIHQIRPHAGQVHVAEYLYKALGESPFSQKTKLNVQDPYSFRCIPQVLGASFDVLNHVKSIFETEINAVTDNPNIFADEDLILSGGNFHGQTLAMAMDYLSIAVHEAGSIAERRIYQLVSGKRGLPLFLTTNPGLQSGMMIPQYTAASIVSQNKQLTMPASSDSIESSAGQEDHVSMGANAATKLLRIVDNLERILAIELMVAAQAFEFRRPDTTAPAIENLLKNYRDVVSFASNDRIFHDDMQLTAQFLSKENVNIY